MADSSSRIKQVAKPRSLYTTLLTRTLSSSAVLVVPTVLVLGILYTSSHIGGRSWISASRHGAIPQAIATTLSEGRSCFQRKADDPNIPCRELRVDFKSSTGLAETFSPATFAKLDRELPAALNVGARTFSTSGLRRLLDDQEPAAGFVAADGWVALVMYQPKPEAIMVKDVTSALLNRVWTSSASETELWATGQSRYLRGTWKNGRQEPIVPQAAWISETGRALKFTSGYSGYRARSGGGSFAEDVRSLETFSATYAAPELPGYPGVDIVISVPTDVMLKYTNYAIITFAFLTILLAFVIALVLRRTAKRHLMPLSALANRVNQIRQGRSKSTVDASVVLTGNESYEVQQLVDAVTGLETKMEENEELAARLEAEQKAVQEATLQSLHEKETLLKEIHHRVKNNLQVISSLLSLQMAEVEDPTARGLLQESVQRVRSMAMIHQQLYGIESLAHIDLSSYAEQLVQSLQAALCPGARVAFSGSTVNLDIHQAVPVALVINEFVTNALKYGMRNGSDRAQDATDIVVSLTQDDDTVEVKVSDYGKGLPEGFDPEHATGLGLKLVRSLTRQLRGELNVTSDDMTTFAIRFPRLVERR